MKVAIPMQNARVAILKMNLVPGTTQFVKTCTLSRYAETTSRAGRAAYGNAGALTGRALARRGPDAFGALRALRREDRPA